MHRNERMTKTSGERWSEESLRILGSTLAPMFRSRNGLAELRDGGLQSADGTDYGTGR